MPSFLYFCLQTAVPVHVQPLAPAFAPPPRFFLLPLTVLGSTLYRLCRPIAMPFLQVPDVDASLSAPGMPSGDLKKPKKKRFGSFRAPSMFKKGSKSKLEVSMPFLVVNSIHIIDDHVLVCCRAGVLSLSLSICTVGSKPTTGEIVIYTEKTFLPSVCDLILL